MNKINKINLNVWLGLIGSPPNNNYTTHYDKNSKRCVQRRHLQNTTVTLEEWQSDRLIQVAMTEYT